jgi:hypothetical protein
MSLRSPTEDEKTNLFQYGSRSVVIPAPEGIQVHFPIELAWIPAFAGMTNTGAFVLEVRHSYFRRSTRRARSLKKISRTIRVLRDLRGEKNS